MTKAPSRKRYEEQNPISSFRTDRELKEKLEKKLEASGITKKEWLEQKIRQDVSSGGEEEKEVAWNWDWTQEWFIETPEQAALMDEISRAFMEEGRLAYDLAPNAQWLARMFGNRLCEHELLRWWQLIASKLLRQGANARSGAASRQA